MIHFIYKLILVGRIASAVRFDLYIDMVVQL